MFLPMRWQTLTSGTEGVGRPVPAIAIVERADAATFAHFGKTHQYFKLYTTLYQEILLLEAYPAYKLHVQRTLVDNLSV